MASSKNLIQSLRSAHDPHFKLEGRVGGLEKGMGIEVAKLHKTLSKSFVLQRKTLARVLGLEKRVAELEAQKAQVEDVVDDILEDGIDDEVPLPQEVEGERPAEGEVGGDDKPSSGVSTLIDPPKRIRATRKKIKAADIKKGTALDKDFGSRVMGQDDKGGYLSKGERIARFKGEKFDPESVKPEDGTSSPEDESGSGGGSKAEKVLSAIAAPISSIADTVDSIFNTLKEQFDQQKDTKEDARIKQEQVDAKKDEKSLEKGGLKKGLEKTSQKALAPFQSIWSKLVNFLTTILFGKVVMRVLDWFGNPENAEKVKSFVRFLKDWWPVLLAGIMAFLPALLGPGGMILGTVVLVAWALPKIIDAAKWLGELPDKIGKFLTGGDAELNKAEKDATSELEADVEKAQSESGVEPPPEPIKLNKGGMVPGSGDTDKVPAMLTPGEFVMSKGAVEKYGADTMAGLNAAAGGTNKPEPVNPAQMTKEDLIAATGPSLMMFMEQQNAAVDENPEAFNGIKLQLDRDGKVPNFGEFIMNIGESEFNKGLAMLQNNESVEPEVKEALVKKALFIRSQTLEDPNFKGDVAFDINKDIPGTAANRLYLKAQEDTSSPAALAGLSARDRALQMNRLGYSGGGLVGRMFRGATNLVKFGAQKARDILPPPMGKKIKVVRLPSKSSQDSTNALIGSAQIPDFQVVHPARRSAKQKTLGITN
jgi:hypothetical protein